MSHTLIWAQPKNFFRKCLIHELSQCLNVSVSQSLPLSVSLFLCVCLCVSLFQLTHQNVFEAPRRQGKRKGEVSADVAYLCLF